MLVDNITFEFHLMSKEADHENANQTAGGSVITHHYTCSMWTSSSHTKNGARFSYTRNPSKPRHI